MEHYDRQRRLLNLNQEAANQANPDLDFFQRGAFGRALGYNEEAEAGATVDEIQAQRD